MIKLIKILLCKLVIFLLYLIKTIKKKSLMRFMSLCILHYGVHILVFQYAGRPRGTTLSSFLHVGLGAQPLFQCGVPEGLGAQPLFRCAGAWGCNPPINWNTFLHNNTSNSQTFKAIQSDFQVFRPAQLRKWFSSLTTLFPWWRPTSITTMSTKLSSRRSSMTNISVR